ncbi:MAG TPA: 30S ribosomal protein S4 [archaeon]|nr:30S ribosomal protein S4 [archaeon]
MGHPRRYSKKYEAPKKPWDKTRLESEKKIKEEFGLRRKHEIWRAEGIVRDFRRRARELQAKPDGTKEKDLLAKLNSLGIHCAKLENVLNIATADILARRLQTIVYKKRIADTPRQARQFIVHGHVLVSGRKVSWPSYLVEKDNEDKISLNPVLAARLVKDEKKE